MDYIGLLGIFCGIAAGNGLFLAGYLIFFKKEAQIQSRLLGFLFVGISLRVAKSIWYFIFNPVADFGVLLGFLGLAGIGPLLYLYVRNYRQERLTFPHLFHLLFPLLGTFYFLGGGWASVIYKIATFLLLFYLWGAYLLHRRNDYHLKSLKSWNLKVIISVFVVALGFVSQHLPGDLFKYALGAGIASIPLYYMLIQSFTTRIISPKKETEVADDLLDRVRQAIEKDQLYREKQLNLNRFSQKIKVPNYLVTKAVNQLYGKSFPETINFFRIEEVKNRLLNQGDTFIKVEGLAYEVGFSSPSTFYAAFKKATGMSPKAFQKQETV